MSSLRKPDDFISDRQTSRFPSPGSRSSARSVSLLPASERRSRHRTQRFSPAPTAVNEDVVKALPQQSLPPWLKLLIRTQKASSILMLLLVATALAMYGWTVYIQQQWGREYRHFETLKKHERQLIANDEALKNQMAQQAETPGSGLVVPDPGNVIFLTPASPRPAVEPKTEFSVHPVPTKPLGY